jgi:ceramide glucosyltransferase
VSILRPICGLENHIEETLRSTFALDYPRYEIVFCSARADDPAALLAQRLIAQHPHVPARLLVGNERISANPKLNNLHKGWRAAAHDLIVMADSNVLMPADYIQRLTAMAGPRVGLVCSPPAGCWPDGLWAELECAFLNTYQARWQYFADSAGLGFAQGKTMLWRRLDLERAGGITALGTDIAEDACATKISRANGCRVRLVGPPFPQPLGRRALGEVWRRQLRWARIRRATFSLYFLPEIFSGAALPFLAGAFAAASAGASAPLTLLCLACLWYGGEALLAFAAKWPLTLRSPLAWIARDLLLPVLWSAAWLGNGFVWRGNEMRLVEDSRAS